MKIINSYYPENDYIPGNTKIYVRNLESRRSGRPIANQYHIFVGGGDNVFQSYETTCLKYGLGVLTVYPEAFGYSTTTSKYSAQWLEEYCGFSPAEVAEVKKLAKTADFSRDCPLYIER